MNGNDSTHGDEAVDTIRIHIERKRQRDSKRVEGKQLLFKQSTLDAEKFNENGLGWRNSSNKIARYIIHIDKSL